MNFDTDNFDFDNVLDEAYQKDKNPLNEIDAYDFVEDIDLGYYSNFHDEGC